MRLSTCRSERARQRGAGAGDPTGEEDENGSRAAPGAAPGAARRSIVGWCAVAALFLFAFAHLAWRGPISVRGHWNLCDFASPWASARLWLTGQSPYDNARLWDTWITSPGAFETDHDFWLALNTPGAHAALAPLAALPAGGAALAWLAICAASVATILGCALALARVPARSITAWLFIAAALASAPLQTIVAVGQLSLPVIALGLLAMHLARGGRDWGAGVALGLAAAVKPQLVAPLLGYYVLCARWRLVLTAALVAVGVTLVAVVPMELRGIPWWSEWSRNLALSTAPGGPNDATLTGPWRNQMIDLRAWLFALLERRELGRELVGATGIILSMLLVAAYVKLVVDGSRANDRRELPQQRQDDLLPLAALMALTLLPVYHKMYDAAVLVLALAWALRSLGDSRLRGVAVLTLASLSIFLVPFDLLPLLMRRTGAFDALANTWIWRAVIYPHHAIAALATALCLLYALWRHQRAPLTRAAPAATSDEDFAADSEQWASATA